MDTSRTLIDDSCPQPEATDATDDQELATAVALLEADPSHHATWIRVATRLYDDPQASPADQLHAQKGLSSAAAALGEAGQLPLAIVACLRLAERGDERGSWAALLQLGAIYGKASTRLDPARRIPAQAPAHAPPRSSSSRTPPHRTAGEGDPADPPDQLAHSGTGLRDRAAAALRRAAAQATARPREPLPPVPLFSALAQDAFVRLAQSLTVVEAPAGAHLLAQGDRGDSLFIVARGLVRIERPDYTMLARLRPGSFFGEMALLTHEPRSAWAIAETPVVLLQAQRQTLDRLMAQDEAIARVLLDQAQQRLMQNDLR